MEGIFIFFHILLHSRQKWQLADGWGCGGEKTLMTCTIVAGQCNGKHTFFFFLVINIRRCRTRYSHESTSFSRIQFGKNATSAQWTKINIFGNLLYKSQCRCLFSFFCFFSCQNLEKKTDSAFIWCRQTRFSGNVLLTPSSEHLLGVALPDGHDLPANSLSVTWTKTTNSQNVYNVP